MVLLGIYRFLHYVPFEMPSYIAWIGIGVSLFSLICLVKPLRILGLNTRRRAGFALIVGVAAVIGGILWPSSVEKTTGEHQRLDDFLPKYQFVEYHEGYTNATEERLIEAVQKVSFADMPAAIFLLRLRALADGKVDTNFTEPVPILDMMTQPGTGFLPLDVSDSKEVVFGMVGRPWISEPPPQIATSEEFLAFSKPGYIRVAFNIRIVEVTKGTFRISTETRALGNDPNAQRTFSRYWRLIYPGSAIIRRIWLDAIIGRAEKTRSSKSKILDQ